MRSTTHSRTADQTAAASVSRTTQARSSSGSLTSAPRVVAQAAQLQAMFGPAIVQRMLRTHEKKNDEGTPVDGTGDKGFFNEYARWLAQDGSVLVDGAPVGVKGLITTLKAAKIAGDEIATTLVDSLMGSGAWKELNGSDKANMVVYVAEAGRLEPPAEDEDLDTYITDYDFAEAYLDEVRGWILSKLSALSEADTIGKIGSIPEKWHADLAYLLYDATKAAYYGVQLPAPVLPPFKKLIGDVNEGKVAGFDFVRKYGGATNQNWGAEFTVASPPPLKDRYDNKAVLHTHYPAADDPPNYAHTKPEEKKYEAGFGHTVVTTNKVTAVSDTDQAWNAL